MVKKHAKWFEDENIQWITVKGKKIYIGKKKRKGQPCHTNWKKSKDTQLVGQKKKNTVRVAKLQWKKCSILSRAK